MLNRRVGIALRSSGPKRVSNPLPRASMREPAPSTTSDSSMPATLENDGSLDGGADADADVRLRDRPRIPGLDVEHVQSGRQSRETAAALSRSCVSVCGPPISAGELRRTMRRKDPALCVLDGSDQRPRQPLRGSRVHLQHGRSEKRTQQICAWQLSSQSVRVNRRRIRSLLPLIPAFASYSRRPGASASRCD